MKKSAFVMISSNYDPETCHAVFRNEGREFHIVVTRDYEEAKEKIVAMYKDGFGLMELCGGFGEERAHELMELTDNKVVLGYVVFDPKQNKLFQDFIAK